MENPAEITKRKPKKRRLPRGVRRLAFRTAHVLLPAGLRRKLRGDPEARRAKAVAKRMERKQAHQEALRAKAERAVAKRESQAAKTEAQKAKEAALTARAESQAAKAEAAAKAKSDALAAKTEAGIRKAREAGGRDEPAPEDGRPEAGVETDVELESAGATSDPTDAPPS